MNVTEKEQKILQKMSDAIKLITVNAVFNAKSGHPGMPLGMSDVASVLFKYFFKFHPEHPEWFDRDRLILSAGHGSMLLYAILYLTGYKDFSIDEIKNFRQLGSKTSGHPEKNLSNAIEVTTGPLGQGFANAVGFAIAEMLMSSKFGRDIMNHKTYVMLGDGCLMEGISHEAASLAGHLKLKNLVVLFDDNNVSIDGNINITSSENIIERFVAYGWHVQTINGHDYEEIKNAIGIVQNSEFPSIIACRTVIGKYLGSVEGKSVAHSYPIDTKNLSSFKESLSIKYNEEFDIPEEVKNYWAETAKIDQFKKWEKNVSIMRENDSELFKIFEAISSNKNINDKVYNILNDLNRKFCTEKFKVSTRKISGEVIEAIGNQIPFFIGGSADLTSSNCTKASYMTSITSTNFDGDYIHYGIREHAMAACVNGLYLHGGITPYCATFFIFSDYCRPAMRMSALMNLPVIYIMTHDSIGVGEDGPTHQPIEQLASLRAMPNINVLRPANAMEVVECWKIALQNKHTPSVLVLSRQDVDPITINSIESENVKRGMYIVHRPNNNNIDFTLIASGSELSLAIYAKDALSKLGYSVMVISAPCLELFDKQGDTYKNMLLGGNNIKVVIEAGCDLCWYKYIGINGIFICVNDFGVSAPSDKVFQHFNITLDSIVTKCLNKIGSHNI